MSGNSAEIVIHPHRLRILQALANRPLTTQEIAAALPDVPKSSIYRHVKKMRRAGVLEVVETRPVRGVGEKVYRLTVKARVTQDDLSGLDTGDHAALFSTYVMTLLQGFSDYLDAAEEIDFLRDRVGYTEVFVYATDEELDAFQAALNTAMLPLLQNKPGPGRARRKFAVIAHPVPE